MKSTLSPDFSYRLRRVLTVSAVLAGGGLLYYLWGRVTGLYMPCLFHLVTGLYCPGCGITRMLSALLEGSFVVAFRSNPAVFLLLPFLAAELALYLWRFLRGALKPPSRLHNLLRYGALGLLLLFGVLRNLPWFPMLQPIN